MAVATFTVVGCGNKEVETMTNTVETVSENEVVSENAIAKVFTESFLAKHKKAKGIAALQRAEAKAIEKAEAELKAQKEVKTETAQASKVDKKADTTSAKTASTPTATSTASNQVATTQTAPAQTAPTQTAQVQETPVAQPAHTHNWVTSSKEVLIQAGYDELHLVADTGVDMHGWSADDINAYCKANMCGFGTRIVIIRPDVWQTVTTTKCSTCGAVQ